MSVLPLKAAIAMEEELKITRRHLPHWELKGAIYFITFRVKRTRFSLTEIALVLNHIKKGHGSYYQLIAAVVLADHVHLVLKPLKNISLSSILKGMKGTLSHEINQIRSTQGTIWQDESYDRIIRDQKDFEAKLNYMWFNPIKGGLSDKPQEYPGWYFDPDYEQFVER
jgi:REP element-mobilizing transposase RayT